MERKEGYVRYKSKNDKDWTGLVSKKILTKEEVQIRRFQGDIFEEDFSHIRDLVIPNPPKGRNFRRLKKSELETGVNYILCPDNNCGLFWDKRFKSLPCESYCPLKEKMQKMIVCGFCKEPIYLPNNHSRLQHVTHECENGHTPIMFTRMSGKYKIIYSKPKD